MQNFSASPCALATSLWKNRNLIAALTRREVIGRYRGSMLGVLWSFFNPVFMLTVYTFVFSVVFQARWAGSSESKTEFALILFAGLLVYSLFAECANRAPGLILANVNYVKKIVFPLEILPVVALLTSVFHLIISLLAWLVFYVLFFGVPQVTVLLLPLVLLPLMLLTLGVSLVLASLGVFLRDISQVVGVVVSTLLFLSPIFYPITALPEQYQVFLNFNPLSPFIEATRNVLVWGKTLTWMTWLVQLLVSAVIAWLGFVWFQKTRKGFADVL